MGCVFRFESEPALLASGISAIPMFIYVFSWSKKNIDYMELWNCSEIPVSHTFTLKRKNPEAEMFSCRLDVVQQEIENPTTSTINVAFQAMSIEQVRRFRFPVLRD